MSHAVTAIIGAVIGLGAIWSGLTLHFGSYVVDGVLGYVGAAIAGAVVALIVRYAINKEFGWP